MGKERRKMNKQVYKKVCSKIGHNWGFKDEGEWILKQCLNCGIQQYFIPYDEEEYE